MKCTRRLQTKYQSMLTTYHDLEHPVYEVDPFCPSPHGGDPPQHDLLQLVDVSRVQVLDPIRREAAVVYREQVLPYVRKCQRPLHAVYVSRHMASDPEKVAGRLVSLDQGEAQGHTKPLSSCTPM